METLTYTIRVLPTKEGHFVASVPALPGCFTQAETVEETVALAWNSIEDRLATIKERGQPIPLETETSRTFAGGISFKAHVKA